MTEPLLFTETPMMAQLETAVFSRGFKPPRLNRRDP
jgi:hypothetical protein